jgi:hypothetical protein
MSVGEQLAATMVDAIGALIGATIDAVFSVFVIPLMEALFVILFPHA